MKEEVITTSFVKRLVKEIEELRKINEQHKKINGELRDIINKAIEYIEDKSLYDGSYMTANDLLKILKGE